MKNSIFGLIFSLILRNIFEDFLSRGEKDTLDTKLQKSEFDSSLFQSSYATIFILIISEVVAWLIGGPGEEVEVGEKQIYK